MCVPVFACFWSDPIQPVSVFFTLFVQEIDGQALLLLTLPTVQEHLELKLGPAIKLCHEIERVKRAFYTRYDTAQPSYHYWPASQSAAAEAAGNIALVHMTGFTGVGKWLHVLPSRPADSLYRGGEMIACATISPSR